jgi:hypothetical protein
MSPERLQISEGVSWTGPGLTSRYLSGFRCGLPVVLVAVQVVGEEIDRREGMQGTMTSPS